MKKTNVLQGLLWVLEGIVVGFGAIMPGISGGTLCVAFKMYRPLMSVLSSPRQGLKAYWKMLLPFVIGCAVGFVGLSGLASLLLEKNSTLIVCVFIGLIVGTLPGQWREAGEKQGRGPASFLALALGFALMLVTLLLLRRNSLMTMAPGIGSFLFSGVLWGFSFIVPGLSSSTLLLFFGLYQPMLEGIARLAPGVILPLAAGMALVIFVLPKAVNYLFDRFDSVCSHAILGVVLATLVMIFPAFPAQMGARLGYILCIALGAVASFFLERLIARLASKRS